MAIFINGIYVTGLKLFAHDRRMWVCVEMLLSLLPNAFVEAKEASGLHSFLCFFVSLIFT